MIFTKTDIKYITSVLHNIYKSAKKMEKKNKLSKISYSFETFVKRHIKDGICPTSCIDYINEYK